jgi:hypothetical protein
LFIAIQFIPVWRWQTNPRVVVEPPWSSPGLRAIAQRACFDCHTNETVWPVYAHVAPVSWLVTRDVSAGRRRLNFSEWGTPHPRRRRGRGGPGEDAEEIIRELRRDSMPPGYYVMLHPGARLTEAERQQFIQGMEPLAGQGADVR